MALTPAQRQTLKAAINAVPEWAALSNNEDTADFISKELDKAAAPTFSVWRTSVALSEVAGNVDGVELVGLTAIKLAAYQSLLLAGSVNPSNARLRAGFDQVFSAAGGNTTRPLLLALWKRVATAGEKIFAVGAGSDASPATLVIEGIISRLDVVEARAL